MRGLFGTIHIAFLCLAGMGEMQSFIMEVASSILHACNCGTCMAVILVTHENTHLMLLMSHLMIASAICHFGSSWSLSQRWQFFSIKGREVKCFSRRLRH